MLEGSVLFKFHAPSLLVMGLIVIGAALLMAVVLFWLRRTGALTRDHIYTGMTAVVMLALLLGLLQWRGEVRVNAYGFMLMLGFVAGTFTALRLAVRRGIPGERIVDLGLVILVGALIGARAMYVLITTDATGAHPPFLDPTTFTQGLSGLSFHGGLLGGTITGGAYIFLTKISFLRTADIAAPSIAIGYAITRIGCFLNGCCYGNACSLPWAIAMVNLHDQVPRHPTQLYASAMGFLMFGILLFLARKESMGRAGRLFLVFLVLEGIERFVMELFREPDPKDTKFLLPHAPWHLELFTSAQILCIGIIAVAVICWFFLPKQPAVGPEPNQEDEEEEPRPLNS